MNVVHETQLGRVTEAGVVSGYTCVENPGGRNSAVSRKTKKLEPTFVFVLFLIIIKSNVDPPNLEASRNGEVSWA